MSIGAEPKKPFSVLNDGLYLVIVTSLALYFVIGGIAWAVLTYDGKEMPEGLAATIATVGGGLLGVLSPTKKDG
ncbi:MAG TPA: hypothetical protein VHM89_14825 [Acidimicrobiales bacterium]|nr:hypothetical protein [Acidimicrobiales bacterium]